MLKCWTKIEHPIHSHVWKKKNGDILGIRRVIGGGASIYLESKGKISGIPNEHTGFKVKREAIKEAMSYMNYYDRC